MEGLAADGTGPRIRPSSWESSRTMNDKLINSLQHQTSKAQQRHSTGMAMAPENHSAQGSDKKRDLVFAACA